MRMLLLALLIALLPLRGWVGDAMAMQQVAPMYHTDMADTHHDAHECHHAAGEADMPAPSDSANTAHADCGTCPACDICHSMVLATSLPMLSGADLPRAAPLSAQPADASAEHSPGFKPPIA